MGSKYQVALSFAGEQRDYVDKVAAALQAVGIKVFYDRYETADMWGKNLAVHLDEVFRTAADVVVFFVSKEYVAKTWPRHEFQAALARAIAERREYLLPVRCDDTDLPGLSPSIGFVRADDYTPAELAELIVQKLGKALPAADPPGAPTAPTSGPRLPRVAPPDFNPFAEAERFVHELQGQLTQRSEALRTSGYVPHPTGRDGRFKLRILQAGQVRFALEVWIGNGMGGDDTINFHHGGRESSTPGSMTGWGAVEWDRDRGQPVIRLTLPSLTSGTSPESLTAQELVDRWWDVLVEYLESSAH